ncbi:MAG: chromosomal replication initiator protein DnaA [Candidatus Eremiobacter antarcticus]|nr:chromosomal replication initiator protein DnaA [Candidatus Eremiobacteraeota bacterium]MBC5808176.1 chromosomal replication initiator protein DnaA [Candidatus Eremiobacteraeota bacterium]PZR63570.1 MAG: chromosomal replication initiator protein DnaA [Candidatus Eremiobacter sp. RRmetagenome_bin22]
METATAVSTNAEYLWESCLGELETRFSKPIFEMWIKPMRLERLATDEVTLTVQNAFAKDWAENRLKGPIVATLAQMIGSPIAVRFVVDETPALPDLRPEPRRDPLPADAKTLQSPTAGASDDFRHTGLNERYTFEQFVVGATNRFAHAAAQAVAESPARAYNPLFIYGAVGLGKTHLMHAIGHRVLRSDQHSRIVYVSSETFTNEFITAIKNNQTVEFRNRYRTVDVLLIDDIQFLEGKEQTQEEFFHTFNTLHEASKQLVISSDRPPKDIQTLENRLRSRFEWGLLTDIQSPDLETREAILRKKAESDGIDVPHEVTSYIAKIIPSNIRQLEGALIKLTAYASLYKQPVTVELAADVLRNEINEMPLRKVTILLIKEKVARFHGITQKELEGQRRDQRLTVPRQIAMYLACDLTNASLPQIAREFGKKDHTTVMYARDKVKQQMERDPEFRSKVRSVLSTISQD